MDTATPHLTLGLLEVRDGQETIRLGHLERVDRAHAEVILDRIHKLYADAGMAPRANRIVVGTGPGSYTGVRVGTSLALGLARAWNAEVIGVPTLEAIAVAQEGIVAVSLDARRGNVYGAIYRVRHGQILETIAGVEKRSLEEFRGLVPDNALWLKEGVISGVAMAQMGLERAPGPLEVMYL